MATQLSQHHLLENYSFPHGKNDLGTLVKNQLDITSGQDGGIGRYTLLPCTTKRSATTNLKMKNNQNCQKIELYGSLTTKELKKKYSLRLVGGAERICGKALAGGPGG